MEKFWKAALGVAGIGAVGMFVLWSLYKDWLKLPYFVPLTQDQTFQLFRYFLFLTFGAAVLGIGAWLAQRRLPTELGDAALHRLEDTWKGVNYIDCENLVGPDVNKAANALQMTAHYWRNRFIDRQLLWDQYGTTFTELFDQLDKCDKEVPGYKKPVKRCKDFLPPVVRTVYQELKKYADPNAK